MHARAYTDEDKEVSGIPWLEMFIRFDTSAARTKKGRETSGDKTQGRADARAKKMKRKSREAVGPGATVLPTLAEELSRFKAIVRDIGSRETGTEQSKMFLMEKRTRP